MIYIGVCDDDAIEVEKVKSLCEQELEQSVQQGIVKSFASGRDLLLYQEPIDILLLDVEMPEMNGFNVAVKLRERKSDILIIFLSSHEELVQEAFQVEAFRYIYKSNPEQKIREALQEAIQRVNHNRKGIFLQSGNRKEWIPFGEIVSIQAIHDSTMLQRTKGESKEFIAKSLKWWEEHLNEDFVRCHHSYLVNCNAIEKIEEKNIHMNNGQRIPLAVRRKTEVKKRYLDTISKNMYQM